MHLRTRLRLGAIVLAACSLLLIPAVASAYAPTGDDFITCVAGGDSNVDCVAGVFEEGCPGTFVAAADGGTLADGSTSDADADGEVAFDFDVPADADGDITVTVECGTKVLADVIANVEDGEVIANAGFDSTTLVAIAVGALALGSGVLAVSRRRNSAGA